MRVVECGKEQLYPISEEYADEVCSKCGELNPRDTHRVFKFIGAFCTQHSQIHYRWVPEDWETRQPELFKRSNRSERIIKAESTEAGHHRYFDHKLLWKEPCKGVLYLEVQWTGFEDGIDGLFRPLNTGYKVVNTQGAFLPFLAALYEWLLYKNKWSELHKLVENSRLDPKEKQALITAIHTPTPSNIFHMLWIFHKIIPDWNIKRKLGRRSPSQLLIDELLWTCRTPDSLQSTVLKRLKRYGPEDDYWGRWVDIVPDSKKLLLGFAVMKEDLRYIGLRFDNSISLISSPSRSARTWIDVAQRMMQWETSYDADGKINNESAKHPSFIANLLKRLTTVPIQTSLAKKHILLKNNLLVSMPLCWMKVENTYVLRQDFITQSNLEKTLNVLEAWIIGENISKLNLSIRVNGAESKKLYLIESFQKRLDNTPISLIIEQIEK